MKKRKERKQQMKKRKERKQQHEEEEAYKSSRLKGTALQILKKEEQDQREQGNRTKSKMKQNMGAYALSHLTKAHSSLPYASPPVSDRQTPLTQHHPH